MANKKGLISRLIEGPERSETYARSTLPTNRWELGFDVFKTNMGKLFGLNWLTLVFFIPLIALFFLRYVFQSYEIAIIPFSQNLSGGYPLYPSVVVIESGLTLTLNFEVVKYLLIAVIIGSVGVSGGFYVMRNMVWAEGVMIGSDFWKGIKQNFFIVFFSLLLYSVFMSLSVISINFASYAIDVGNSPKWLMIAAQVISYILMVLFTVMVMYMVTLGVTYKLKFFSLVRNAFILTIALFPLNLFFALFAALFIILIVSGFSLLTVVGVVLCLTWGVSLFMLIWTDYSQWVFDKYVNDKVPGAKKNRGIYKRTDDDDGEVVVEKSKYAGRAIKPITDYEVELYELPTSFSRKDLEKLAETKEAMRRDSDKYAEEHSASEESPVTIDELMNEDEKEGGNE
ncbi:MAG: hypothetical protein IJS67_00735 [Clostridia bacterium]|nr:hypothetical protein [Clostridia bacterium]